MIGRSDGNKRVHQRLGPAPSQPAGDRFSKVCYHWRAGRCNRPFCTFLHGEPSDDAPPKRPHHQPSGGDHVRPAHHPVGLTWRNPQINGKQRPPSKWGNLHGGAAASSSGRPPASKDRICNFFSGGLKCKFGDGCRFLHSWSVGDSFSLVTPLKGHQKVITGITLPSGSDKLYSGSKDESVRVWDCQSGQCVGVINLGVEVGCMINEGPWVFVGILNAVKAWNTQTSTELSLEGPNGQVYALVAGNEMLFAGIQDGSILAWKFNAVLNCFEPVASLTGHQHAVVSLVVGAMRIYSGSMDSTIKVWDLTTLQCLQTLTDHKDVVMSILCWNEYLISCSLDKTIKIWVASESGKFTVTYTHDEENGVLGLCGMHDAQANPLLLCSCNDNSVRLYNLPSFSERGKIFAMEEVRAMQVGPGGLFFTGDGTGDLKVWKWSTSETPVPLS